MLDRPAVFYRLGTPAFDARITRLLGELRGMQRRGHGAPTRVEDPGRIIHELRMRRSPAELARHRRACELSRAGHIALILPDFARAPVEPSAVGIYRYLGNKRWHSVPTSCSWTLRRCCTWAMRSR